MSGKSPDDINDFYKAMSDVKPLQSKPRVSLTKSRTSAQQASARKANAEEGKAALSNELSGEYLEQIDPNAILSYQKPGVQHGVFRNLRLGKYAIDARLDLHRHTVEQARMALDTFVKDCLAADIRCALITHGKGEGRKQPAVLKSCVAHWLPQLDSVLAFHSAQRHHGGSGATYLLLKKSQNKRQENLERHQKRRN